MGRKPTDEILGWDITGVGKRRPIFGYDNGVAVCNAICPGTQGKRRCKSTIRMNNGRCSTHGGKTPAGPGSTHFRTGKYAQNWGNSDKAQTLIDAVNDPDFLSLRQELALNFVHLDSVLKKFEQGTDTDTWNKIGKIAERLEGVLFTEEMTMLLKSAVAVNPSFSKVGTDMEELVRLIKSGANETKLFREMNEALDVRRKLVETETKRNMLEQNHMPAAQVIFLFSEIVAVVRRVFGKYTIEMRQFAGELNSLQSLMPQQNRVSDSRPVPPDVLASRQAIVAGVENQADSEDAEFSELDEE